MKLKRMLQKTAWNSQDDLYEIDSEFFSKSIRLEVEQCLEILRSNEMPSFSQKITYKFPSEESCTLFTSSQALTMRQEALWGCFYAFASIPLETFAFIYLAIFLENSVAFFSVNSSLLSATLYYLFNYF